MSYHRCQGTAVVCCQCQGTVPPALFTSTQSKVRPWASRNFEESFLLTLPISLHQIWGSPGARSSCLALQAPAHPHSSPILSPISIPRASFSAAPQLLSPPSHLPRTPQTPGTGHHMLCCCCLAWGQSWVFACFTVLPGQGWCHLALWVQPLGPLPSQSPPALQSSGSAPCSK